MLSKSKTIVPIFLFSGLVLFVFDTSICAKELYVSTTGSDSVLYADNDINAPWLTVAHAWTTAEEGDTVYYRTGTYTFSSQLNYWGYSDNVTHKTYNGESVTWTSSLADSTIIVEHHHITVDGIDIIADSLSGAEAGFFKVGYDHSATHFTLKNCTATVGAGSDNAGLVHASDADYITIENCSISGEGSDAGSLNTALIWLDRLSYATIKNNELSDAQCGIYFKHSNVRTSGTGPIIKNNYIKDCGRAGLMLNCNYGVIRNNILVNADIYSGDDGGTGSGGTGSDYNEYSHNTLYNTRWQSVCEGSNDPGATHNEIHNNLFHGQPFGPEYDSSGCNENIDLTSDYNLFPSPTAVQYRSTAYTLMNWKSVFSTDENSMSGDPSFIGGVSPSSIIDYELASASLGYRAGSDGKDIGANVHLVGVPPRVEPSPNSLLLLLIPVISSTSAFPSNK